MDEISPVFSASSTNTEPYLSPAEVIEGISRGILFTGHISYLSASFATVNCPILSSPVLLRGSGAINRAWPGDEVVVSLDQPTKWATPSSAPSYPSLSPSAPPPPPPVPPQPSGLVVAILTSVPRTNIPGQFTFTNGVLQRSVDGLLPFQPTDPRLPRLLVHPNQEDKEDEKEEGRFRPDYVYTVRVCEWLQGSSPLAALQADLGPAAGPGGEAALLAASGFTDDYSGVHIDPCYTNLARRDVRSDFTLTIDPSTAKDLDDALSVRVVNKHTNQLTDTPTNDTVYEIGVHIADVTSFFPRGSPLDQHAAAQGVTLYLPSGPRHLLPPALSEDLCSLNPCEDRLAFSVMWRMDGEGRMVAGDVFVGRTVVHSRARLSYEHAQKIIDGNNNNTNNILNIGNNTEEDTSLVVEPGSEAVVAAAVHHLHHLSHTLRTQRLARGALSFSPKTDSQDAHHLVEEFMVVANQLAALRLQASFPALGVVRSHPAPAAQGFGGLVGARFPKVETRFDSGERVAESLQKLAAALQPPIVSTECPSSGVFKELAADTAALATRVVNQAFMATSLQPATYSVSTSAPSADAWSHYGIASQLYFHFTSPIRRYPDQLLHRLLQAAIDCERDQCGYNAGWARPEDLPHGASAPTSAPSHAGEPGRTLLRPHCLTWPTTQPLYAPWPRELLPPAELVRSAHYLYNAEAYKRATQNLQDHIGTFRDVDSVLPGRMIFTPDTPAAAQALAHISNDTIGVSAVFAAAACPVGEVAPSAQVVVEASRDLAAEGWDMGEVDQILQHCGEKQKAAKQVEIEARHLELYNQMISGKVPTLPPPSGKLPGEGAGVLRFNYPAIAAVTAISSKGKITLSIPDLDISHQIDLRACLYHYPPGTSPTIPAPAPTPTQEGTDSDFPHLGAPVGYSLVLVDDHVLGVDVRALDVGRAPLPDFVCEAVPESQRLRLSAGDRNLQIEQSEQSLEVSGMKDFYTKAERDLMKLFGDAFAGAPACGIGERTRASYAITEAQQQILVAIEDYVSLEPSEYVISGRINLFDLLPVFVQPSTEGWPRAVIRLSPWIILRK